MRKTYRLFGLPIWAIEVEDLEPEPEPDTDDDDDEPGQTVIISAQVERPIEPTPTFGFVDHKDTPEWTDKRK